MIEKIRVQLGCACVDIKEPVEAGSVGTVVYTYEADHAIDDTGCIKIVFRFAGDAGTPQFDTPGGINYCSVSTTADCRIEPRWDPKGHTRPWGKALYLKVMGGYVDKGDKITVVFGDRSKGSPGWRMQTFCEDTFEFKTLVDPYATYQFKELPESPVIKLIPGKPVKAVCIAPSQVVVNSPFEYYQRYEDRWGNATGKAQKFTYPGFSDIGVHRIEKNGAVSNPVNVLENEPELSIWWADFHGQSEETIGSNSIEDYFNYARDCSKVDIVAHQGNDFQVTDEFWAKINHTAESYYEPGKLVTFPGYEWSGNTPLGGDRNIYHKEPGGPIYRSCHDLLPDGYSKFEPAETADILYGKLDAEKSFAFAHVGGRYADMAMHKENLEVGIEIHSAWGTFEWLVEDALKHGYHIGICANSDEHKCRPGASYPGGSKFGSYGGLTCVMAEKLDRKSVFAAMKARHFYATTGNRMLVDVKAVTPSGQQAIMGDIIEAESATLQVKINGTAPLDYIEIRNGLDNITTIRPYNQSDLDKRIKVVWSGAEVKGRDRITHWNGALKIKENEIKSFTPVNFWNPDKLPEQNAPDEISWQSITTGGVTGIILELEDKNSGKLSFNTNQINCEIDISSIGMEPLIYELGGIEKQLEIYRLPQTGKKDLDFSLDLRDLKPGDNPVYVKVMQQDGHIAWSSPIYIVKSFVTTRGDTFTA